MRIKRHFLLLALAMALASGASAVAAVPAGMNAGKIPDMTVWDEANVQHSLWDELRAAGSGPVIVLPVYTRCSSFLSIRATTPRPCASFARKRIFRRHGYWCTLEPRTSGAFAISSTIRS